MTEISICKAQPLGSIRAPNTTIEIASEIPPFPSLLEAREFYQKQAILLADALFQSLPGGTLDELMAELMKRRASYFKVSFDAFEQPSRSNNDESTRN